MVSHIFVGRKLGDLSVWILVAVMLGNPQEIFVVEVKAACEKEAVDRLLKNYAVIGHKDVLVALQRRFRKSPQARRLA